MPFFKLFVSESQLQQSWLINFKRCYRDNYFFYDYMFGVLILAITLDISVLELIFLVQNYVKTGITPILAIIFKDSISSSLREPVSVSTSKNRLLF